MEKCAIVKRRLFLSVYLAIIISVVLGLVLTGNVSASTLSSSGNIPDSKVPILVGYDHPPTSDDINQLKNLGASIKYVYHLINAVAAAVPQSKVSDVQSNPDITLVERDANAQAVADTTPWGIARIGADQVQPQEQGQGIKIAILDTGIDATNPDLSVSGGAAFISYFPNPPLNPAWNDDSYTGHGTHVAGTAAALLNGIGVVGVAPQVSLYSVKVLDMAGGGYVSDIISGIQWAVDNGMNIINMSLETSFDVTQFHDACNAAYQRGLVLVAAAGNDGYTPGQDTVGYPARYSSVIGVGATDNTDQLASFSSVGPEVELTAPGVSIYSTLPGGNYGYLSGTSMSAPHVAGTVALLMGAGMSYNEEIRARLHSTAQDLGAPGLDSFYGWGLVQANAAYNQLQAAIAGDTTAPTVAVSPNPSTLPNLGKNRYVNVVVNGSANDEIGGSGIASLSIVVTDEYGRMQPTVVPYFGATIQLEAYRYPYNKNPRHYTITANTADVAGHVTQSTAVVLVP